MVAQWKRVRLQRERSGFETYLLEQDTLLPESTGNTQEVVADMTEK